MANCAVGARASAGMWWNFDRIDNTPDAVLERWFSGYPEIIRIVLTVAHFDHDTANRERSNQAALCKRCHLNHDWEQHQANAAATWLRKRDEASGHGPAEVVVMNGDLGTLLPGAVAPVLLVEEIIAWLRN